MISLAALPSGARAVVVGLPHMRGLAKRLVSLGLTPGAEVQVLQNWGRGPLTVEVRCARLALGRGQAARVMVEPLADAEGQEARPECPDPGAANT